MPYKGWVSDQKKQLIDSLTAHLDKESEDYLHAHQYLEKTIDSENKFLEDSLSASEQRGRKRYVTLAAILGAFITLVYLTVTHPYFESGDVTELMSNIILDEEEPVLPEYVSEEDAFLLLGDQTKPTENERLKAVWDAHESEARYYMRYAAAYFDDNGSFPTDFIEVGVTPQNLRTLFGKTV